MNGFSKDVTQHLFSSGPKRILTLDGGGIRGVISLQILGKIEQLLQKRHGPQMRLCDYFDLIVGTSTGAIIAAALATGKRVNEIDLLYRKLGSAVFKAEFFRRGFFRAKFDSAFLEAELKNQFADIALGSTHVKTGLAIILKRLDTSSPWVVYNSPNGKYYNRRPGKQGVANKDILLRHLIRASAAAPTYFEPEQISVADNVSGAFVDGGVSPHNNPALKAYLLATLSGYGLRWRSGADQLLLVSIGSGSSKPDFSQREIFESGAAILGVKSLVSLMSDTACLNEMLLQSISDSPTARSIDRVVGDLQYDQLAGTPLLSYLRYDARLESGWLKKELSLDYDSEQLESLECLSDADNIEELTTIGNACASHLVKPQHFRSTFDLESNKSKAYH